MVKENENKDLAGEEAKQNDNIAIIVAENNDDNQSWENNKVGTILGHERLKKNLDLAEIAQILCIRRSYLEAIEKGNYSELPTMPYSAGFVNSYAKYLGLNNTRITQLFREEINIKPDNVNAFVNEDVPAEAALPNKVYIIGAGVAVFLIAGLWGIFSPSDKAKTQLEVAPTSVEETEVVETQNRGVEYFETQSDAKQTEAEEKKSIALVEEKVTPQVIISEESYVEKTPDKAEKPKTAPQKGIEIKITGEDTWLEVKTANRVYLSKILKVGDTYRLPDVAGLTLSSGKVEGVEVYVNGKLTPVISANKKININLDNVLKAAH